MNQSNTAEFPSPLTKLLCIENDEAMIPYFKNLSNFEFCLTENTVQKNYLDWQKIVNEIVIRNSKKLAEPLPSHKTQVTKPNSTQLTPQQKSYLPKKNQNFCRRSKIE